MRYELMTNEFAYNGSSITERILANRGIKPENVNHYLYTNERDNLDFRLLDNMEEGAKMLMSHVANNDKILVQVDSDADGLTSAATLINYLNILFPHFAQTNISYRLHTAKEHGLILSTIPDDIQLVIAPDSSSNDYEVHAALRERGTDVLVLDHHDAERISENACIINNQLCDYPNKELSGVGIVYKFCCYLDSLLNVDYADEFLDLVALGMIADMMDLREYETKYLIGIGLKNIQNPFFKGMIAKNQYFLRDGVTPIGVAFSVAPAINAVTRVGTASEKVTLFESMLDFRGYELVLSTKKGAGPNQQETRVEQACRNCVNIKKRQSTAVDTSLEIIEQIIEEEHLVDDKLIAVRVRPPQQMTKSLTGLIANKLVAKYQRPVLILNQSVHEEEAENGDIITSIEWEGSGRGYAESGFDDCRSFLCDSGFVHYAEGHPNAFGVGIYDENFDELVSYANDALKNFDFTPKYSVDYIFKADEINEHEGDILQVADMNDLWGQGMPEPYMVIEGINLTKDNVHLFKGSTLKINLPGTQVSLIKFRSSEEEYESLYSELGCVTINVVGQCRRNTFGGVDTPEIEITDYEIVGRTAYYF